MASSGGLPGYPSAGQINQQAAAAAGAAVPTRGSIMQQYGQGLQDTSAFTRALISLLRSGPNAGAGYMQAEQAQNAIDSAAANRLAALGSPYSAGSAAALQGMGNSALSGLLSRGAAASAYGAKMPGVAAARGALAQQGLITARNQALTQRNQAYTQAYQQARQQALQNALAYSTALGNYNLNNQKLAQQQAQFQAQLGEQAREFNLSNAYRYASLAASARTDTGSGATIAKALGLTQNEFMGSVSKAIQSLSGTPADMARVPVYGPNGKVIGYNLKPVGGSGSPSALDAGVPFAQAIQTLITHDGTDPRIALYAATRIYQGAQNAPPGSPAAHAWQSFVSWMASHGSMRYRSIQQRATRSKTGPSNQRNPHPGR